MKYTLKKIKKSKLFATMLESKDIIIIKCFKEKNLYRLFFTNKYYSCVKFPIILFHMKRNVNKKKNCKNIIIVKMYSLASCSKDMYSKNYSKKSYSGSCCCCCCCEFCNF